MSKNTSGRENTKNKRRGNRGQHAASGANTAKMAEKVRRVQEYCREHNTSVRQACKKFGFNYPYIISCSKHGKDHRTGQMAVTVKSVQDMCREHKISVAEACGRAGLDCKTVTSWTNRLLGMGIPGIVRNSDLPEPGASARVSTKTRMTEEILDLQKFCIGENISLRQGCLRRGENYLTRIKWIKQLVGLKVPGVIPVSQMPKNKAPRRPPARPTSPEELFAGLVERAQIMCREKNITLKAACAQLDLDYAKTIELLEKN